MNPKPIIFMDFDGTICFDKYWRSLPKNLHEQVQDFIFGEDRTLLSDWIKGKYTAEEINQLVSEQIKMPFAELWELFVQDCCTMKVSEEVLQKILSLKDKYTLVLITGNMDSFTRFTVPSLQLDKYFDYINNSIFFSETGDNKETNIFVRYAKKLGVPISECFLLVDSIENCELFSSMGGRAYLVTPEHDVMSYLTQML